MNERINYTCHIFMHGSKSLSQKSLESRSDLFKKHNQRDYS